MSILILGSGISILNKFLNWYNINLCKDEKFIRVISILNIPTISF